MVVVVKFRYGNVVPVLFTVVQFVPPSVEVSHLIIVPV